MALVSPSDGSVLTDATPDFDWGDASGTTGYELQVDNNADFSSPELTQTTTGSSYTAVTPFAAGVYYWKVHATNSAGPGPWSPTWQFTMITPPPAVTLVSPTDGAVLSNPTPVFDWNDVSGATGYQLQVDNNADFSSPELTQPTTASSYTAVTPFAAGVYYWKVYATNSAGPGPVSSSWQFTMNLSPSAKTVVINEVWPGDNDWIELYNYGTGPVDLTGWQVVSKTSVSSSPTTFTLPAFTLAPDAYVVLYETAGANTAVRLYFNQNISWVHNSEGSSALLNASSQGVDFVRWGGSTQTPPTGTQWSGNDPTSPGSGSSLGRDAQSTDTDTGADFTAQTPTEGAVNSSSPPDPGFTPSQNILVVDDDDGKSYQTYYEAALTGNDLGYDLWNVWVRGPVPGTVLDAYVGSYKAVVWLIGDDYTNTLTSAERIALTAFLNSGGRVFISGQDIGYDLVDNGIPDEKTWYETYLYASFSKDASSYRSLVGTSGDPIGDGLSIGITGGDGANNQDYPSEIAPLSPAMTVWTYNQNNSAPVTMKTAPQRAEPRVDDPDVLLHPELVSQMRDQDRSLSAPSGVLATPAGAGGLRVDTGVYKLVYFSFGFEAISKATDRGVIMARIIDWLTAQEAPSITISINDTTVIEGDTNTTTATFTVKLSGTGNQAISVNYTTADGTASSGSDYTAVSGTVNFPTGTTLHTIDVIVNGDVLDESDETFFINLTAPTNATISDGQGQVTIIDDDSSPIALDDNAVTDEDVPVNIRVLGNDHHPDNVSFYITQTTIPDHGIAIINPGDTTITYTPAPDFNGADVFSYTIGDGHGGTATATVTMMVSPVDDPPVAHGSTIETQEDSPVSGTLTGSDPDNDPLTFSIDSQGSKGTVTINDPANGTYTYTPYPNAIGEDSFTFVANDGIVDSEPATVTVTITSVNDAPVLAGIETDALAYTENDGPTVITGTLTIGDVDDGAMMTEAFVSIISGYMEGEDALSFTAQNGISGSFDASASILRLSGQAFTSAYQTALRSVTYQNTNEDPDTGSRIIRFTTDDGVPLAPVPQAPSNAVTRTITVTSVNDTPVATDDAAITDEDVFADLNVLANDTDIENDALIISASDAQSIEGGTVTDQGDGILRYTPPTDFNGEDSFTYTVSDGNGGSDQATVTVTVNTVNDAPVAEDASTTTLEDTPVSGNLTATDVDNDDLSFSLVDQALFGTATVDASGAFTYTPDPDANGTDHFTFRVNDGIDDSNIGMITVEVAPVNDAPQFITGRNHEVTEDADPQTESDWVTDISPGPSDEDDQTATFEVTTDNPSLFIEGPAISSDGTLTYTLAPDAYGEATVMVVLRDGGGTADGGTDTGPTQTFTIVVTAVNDAPMLTNIEDVDLVYTENEGSVFITATLTINDVDNTTMDQARVQISENYVTGEDVLVFAGQNGITGSFDSITGTLTLSGAASTAEYQTVLRSVTYENPSENPSTDRRAVSFIIDDGVPEFSAPIPLVSSIAVTRNITVTAVNDAPIADNRTIETQEDMPVSGVLSGSDEENDTLTFSIVNQGDKGTVTIDDAATGAFTYTPNPNVNGSDTFTFKVHDGIEDSNIGAITVTITPVNDSPVADSDAIQTQEDTPISGTLTGSDPDNDPLTFSIDSQGSKGTVTIDDAATGAFTYVPNPDANGSDSFTFVVNDGTLDSNVGTIAVTITPENDQPVADSDAIQTQEDTPISATLTGSDPDDDPLIFSIASQGSKGTVTINNPSTGAYTYTPYPNAIGEDSFTFVANDDIEDSKPATVTVIITPVNDAPVAVAGSLSVQEDTEATGTLSATDIDGDALTFSIVDQGSKGEVTITDALSGAYTYIPHPDANGSDTFTFKASDGTEDSNVDTVSMTISSVNDAPVVADGVLEILEDTPDTGLLSGEDIDGDALTFTIVDQGSKGEVTITDASSGAYTYTPHPDANGSDSFTFIATDGVVDSEPGSITLTISPVNDAPSFTVGPDQNELEQSSNGWTISGWATDISAGPADEAGQTLNFLITDNSNPDLFTDPPSVDPDGTLRYALAENANGTAIISILLKDNGGTENGGKDRSDVQIFTIHITGVNDPPGFTKGPDHETDEDAGPQVVENWAKDISAGPPDEVGQSLTFEVTSSQPGLFSVQPAIDPLTGKLTYTPAENVNGTTEVSVVLKDNGGTDNDGEDSSPEQSFTITIHAVNDAPVVTVPESQTTNEDTSLVFSAGSGNAIVISDVDAGEGEMVITLTATSTVSLSRTNGLGFSQGDGSDDDTMTFTGRIAAVNAALNGLQYMPTKDFSGQGSLKIEVSDQGNTGKGGAQNIASTVVITIQPVNDPPQIITESLAEARQDIAYSYQITVHDPEGDAVTYGVTASPAWLSIDPATGTLMGTPGITDVGDTSVTITATDAHGGAFHRTYPLTVKPDATPPAFSALPAAIGVTDTKATIAWSSNERTTGTIRYGKDTEPTSTPHSVTIRLKATGTVTFMDSVTIGSYSTSHQHTVAGLIASTRYSGQVTIRDAASNATMSPEFFFTTLAAPDSTPPVFVSLPAIVGKTENSLTIGWESSEPARAVLRMVTRNDTTLSAPIIDSTSIYRTTSQLTIRNLDPSSTYDGQIELYDNSGNGPATNGFDNNPARVTGKTRNTPDTTPPVLTVRPSVRGITDRQATVLFETNEPSTTIVRYGTTKNMGTEVKDTTLVTAHSMVLAGLTPATTYYFSISTSDQSGNQLAFTAPDTFITKPTPDTSSPIFTNGPIVAGVTSNAAIVQWKTNELSNSVLRYRPTEGTDSMTVVHTEMVLDHSVSITGLHADTKYQYAVSSTDGSNNTSVEHSSAFRTMRNVDTQSPVFLSWPTVTFRSTDRLRVEWNTNEPSDSRGKAGTSISDTTIEALDQNFVTKHVLTFTGLTAETRYFFKVGSQDAAGNATTSALDSVQTLAIPDTIAPEIRSIAVSAMQDRALINWRTSEPANSRVVFGADSIAVALGNTSIADVVEDGAYVDKHVVTLTGLSPSTRYFYRLQSADPAGNASLLTPSVPRNFTTHALRDTIPPLLTAVTVDEVSATRATVTWKTNEPANSYIHYGTSSMSLDFVVEDGAVTEDHRITLTNLNPGTVYFFRVYSRDPSNNTGNFPSGRGAALGFVTPTPDVDILAPIIIEGPTVAYSSDTQAIVKWKTDEDADDRVFYKRDLNTLFAVQNGPAGTRKDHMVTITGLEAGATYDFIVASTDRAGNEVRYPRRTVVFKAGPLFTVVNSQNSEANIQFTTRSVPDMRVPAFLSGPTVVKRTAGSATIRWVTDELATSAVDYGINGLLNQRYEDGALVTTHILTLTNLSPSTLYNYTVSSTDPSNNGPSVSTTAVFQTTAQPDVEPPAITGIPSVYSIYISNENGVSSTVMWSTDEPADSKVEFGATAALGDLRSISEAVIQHRVVLTRLTPGATYYFRISSTDQSGNGPTQGSIQSFTTAIMPDTSPPVLNNVSASGTAIDRIMVTWSTDEPATGLLRAVRSGTTDTVTVVDGTYQTSHSHVITDTGFVRPGATYQLIVESVDAGGNTARKTISATIPSMQDVTPPVAPASLTAVPGHEKVVLMWPAVSESDLSGYEIFQGNTRIASGVQDMTYEASGLTNGVAYVFEVKALDRSGNTSHASPQATATPSAVLAPGAPAVLSTSTDGNPTEVVSLKPILVVSNATPVSGRPTPTYTFAVYGDSALTSLVASVSGIPQGTDSNPTHWQVINLSLSNGVALLDSTRYFWRSRANDTVTDGPWSNTATFFTSSTKPTAIELASFSAQSDRGIVNLTWRTFQDTGINGFRVYRSLNAAGPFELITSSLITGREGLYEFWDGDVTFNLVYYYQIEAVGSVGQNQRFGPVSIRVTPPNAYSLEQNFPNPFNPTTTIRYELPRSGNVRLVVYNLLGQEVVTLVDAPQEAGFHTMQWNGLNTARQRVASGVYFYRISIQADGKNEFSSAKKMLLLK